jgi:hypothetical protein
MLVNPSNPTNAYQRREIEAAGAAKAIKVITAETRSKADLEHVPPQLNRGDSREAKDRRVYRH